MLRKEVHRERVLVAKGARQPAGRKKTFVSKRRERRRTESF
jgi:hypothetical protein